MFENTQNWELFGYDIRQVGSYWRAAWREYLRGSDSPLVGRLDEPVRVRREGQEMYFFAGKPVRHADPAAASCDAVMLPDDDVLQKTLDLPLAAETDLDAVMALEVAANNPFPAEDTVSGWTIMGRSEDRLRVGLAIASTSAVMSYLARHFDCHDPQAYEVWAQIEGSVVVLRGFGESRRQGRYRRRLVKIAGLVGLCSLIVIAVAGTYAVTSYFKLQHYQEMSALLQRESSDASRARESLLIASEAIAAVNGYVTNYPNPHIELARLTRLLGDDASIVEFEMTGSDLKVQGRAKDAAEVVQQLTREPAYLKVTSPQAITRMGNTGYEQFHLKITLAGSADS